MKFPVVAPNDTSKSFEKEEYEALTATEAREYGFLTHPAVVYEMAADKIEGFDGVPEITLDAVSGGKYIPTGTKYNGCEEAHYSFNKIKVSASSGE